MRGLLGYYYPAVVQELLKDAENEEGGYLLSAQDFNNCVLNGAFIDYDGFAEIIVGRSLVQEVYPSNWYLFQDSYPPDTLLVWYNK